MDFGDHQQQPLPEGGDQYYERLLDAACIVMDLAFAAYREGSEQKVLVLTEASLALSQALAALKTEHTCAAPVVIPSPPPAAPEPATRSRGSRPSTPVHPLGP